MKYLKRKNYFTIFTLLFILVTVVLSGISLSVAHYEHVKSMNEINHIKSESEIEGKIQDFNNYFDSYKDILNSLNENKIFKNYLENPLENTEEINSLFDFIISQKRHIMQLRFIDVKGLEQLRFDRKAAGEMPYQITNDNLQDKSRRYYFQETIKLEKNQFYTSKLDLNIENGKVEIPYNPVLRIAMPVFKNGSKEGILIINIFIKKFLSQITKSEFFNVYLYDQDSFLIYSNDKKYTNFGKYIDGETTQKELFNSLIAKKTIFTSNSETIQIGIKNKIKLSIWNQLNNTFILLIFFVIPLALILGYIISRIPKKLFDNLEEQQKIMVKQARLIAMAEMVESLAHQWRQPLNAISVLTQEIKLNYKMNSLDENTMNKLSQEILIYLENLSKTIDIFRTFFKPKNIQEKVNLEQSLESLIEILTPQTEKNSIHINLYKENRTRKKDGFILITLENELKQSILNLLNNSIEIILRREPKRKDIDINLVKEKDFIKISVTDYAGGVEENIIDKIFEPYFTTKENELQGSGLGLYFTKMIVENSLKGQILFSNTAYGAKFEIIFELNN